MQAKDTRHVSRGASNQCRRGGADCSGWAYTRSAHEDAIPNTEMVYTIVGGEVVYRGEGE